MAKKLHVLPHIKKTTCWLLLHECCNVIRITL